MKRRADIENAQPADGHVNQQTNKRNVKEHKIDQIVGHVKSEDRLGYVVWWYGYSALDVMKNQEKLSIINPSTNIGVAKPGNRTSNVNNS